MNTGWWDTAFLWGLGVSLVVGFVWGGIMAFKQESNRS
jgi:hypothetical protein